MCFIFFYFKIWRGTFRAYCCAQLRFFHPTLSSIHTWKSLFFWHNLFWCNFTAWYCVMCERGPLTFKLEADGSPHYSRLRFQAQNIVLMIFRFWLWQSLGISKTVAKSLERAPRHPWFKATADFWNPYQALRKMKKKKSLWDWQAYSKIYKDLIAY